MFCFGCLGVWSFAEVLGYIKWEGWRSTDWRVIAVWWEGTITVNRLVIVQPQLSLASTSLPPWRQSITKCNQVFHYRVLLQNQSLAWCRLLYMEQQSDSSNRPVAGTKKDRSLVMLTQIPSGWPGLTIYFVLNIYFVDCYLPQVFP